MPKTQIPLALELVPIRPLVLSVPMRFVLVPLTDVAVTVTTFPNAVAVLNPINPLTIISIASIPRVEPLSADATLLVVP